MCGCVVGGESKEEESIDLLGRYIHATKIEHFKTHKRKTSHLFSNPLSTLVAYSQKPRHEQKLQKWSSWESNPEPSPLSNARGAMLRRCHTTRPQPHLMKLFSLLYNINNEKIAAGSRLQISVP
jgi:hypothetical protein